MGFWFVCFVCFDRNYVVLFGLFVVFFERVGVCKIRGGVMFYWEIECLFIWKE